MRDRLVGAAQAAKGHRQDRRLTGKARVVMPDLAILYEHPRWLSPLFAALDRRGVDYTPIHIGDHRFDPASRDLPALVVFNRIAMSSFLRSEDHPIFYAASLLDRWETSGARIVNGPRTLAIDSSKARQLALMADLGIATPRTIVVHQPSDVPAAAEEIGYPLIVKANIGGSGAGIVRYDDATSLRGAGASGDIPTSIDRVLLVQDYVPARGGRVMRIEMLGGGYLYGLEIDGSGDSFDLCPADVCLVETGKPAMTMRRAEPAPALIAAAESIAAAMGLDVGGVEYIIDDRDGTPRFYDINAMSNFVADPLAVLGWDPHERLVDYLVGIIEEQRA